MASGLAYPSQSYSRGWDEVEDKLFTAPLQSLCPSILHRAHGIAIKSLGGTFQDWVKSNPNTGAGQGQMQHLLGAGPD